MQIKVDKKDANYDLESLKSDKVRKRKSIIDYQREREIQLQKSKEKEN